MNVSDLQLSKAASLIVVSAGQLKLTVVRLLQLLKAEVFIETTDAGIEISSRAVQPQKAFPSMVCNSQSLSNVTFFRLLQP